MAEASIGRRVRSGAVLGVAHLSEAFLPFVRSVALARLLSPTEFGIGIVISTTAMIVELFTDLGLDRMALRAGVNEDAQKYLKTLHSVNLLRGLLNGTILVIFAPFVAAFVGAKGDELLFSSLGVICFARGLNNFQPTQMMQRYVYWPSGAIILGMQGSWTVATIVFAIWLKDARAMAFGIMVSQAVGLLMSHVLAETRWRLAWDKTIVKEILNFGVPLVPSSLLTAINQMLDRYIISGILGPAFLGLYSAAYMMQMMPRQMLARLMRNLILPAFVNSEHDVDGRESVFNIWALLTIGVSFMAAIGVLCVARPALFVLYGTRFVPAPLVTVLIALDLIPKFLQIELVLAPSLAFGETRAYLRYVLLTAPNMGIAAIGALITHSLEGFLEGMVAADIVTTIIIAALATRRYPYSKTLLMGLLAGSLALFGLPAAVLLRWPGLSALDLGAVALQCAAGAVSIVLFLGLLLLLFPAKDLAKVRGLLVPRKS